MKTRNTFIIKFALVTLLIGFFSPSITVENTSVKRSLENLTVPTFTVSLFTQAEARRGRGRHKGKRRSNYRHRKGHRRGRGRGRRRGRNILGGIAAGVAIGAAINSASRNNNCPTVYVRGLRYQDCGGDLIRY